MCRIDRIDNARLNVHVFKDALEQGERTGDFDSTLQQVRHREEQPGLNGRKCNDIAERYAVAAIDDQYAANQPDQRRCHGEKRLNHDEESSTGHVLPNGDLGEAGVGFLKLAELFGFASKSLGYDDTGNE